MYNQQMIMQNTNSNNSNFNSVDFSDAAVSSRRMYNESSNNAVGAGGQVIQGSSNVKRNNFLQMLSNPLEDTQNAKYSESHSQPNPPTLRKITLN